MHKIKKVCIVRITIMKVVKKNHNTEKRIPNIYDNVRNLKN